MNLRPQQLSDNTLRLVGFSRGAMVRIAKKVRLFGVCHDALRDTEARHEQGSLVPSFTAYALGGKRVSRR